MGLLDGNLSPDQNLALGLLGMGLMRGDFAGGGGQALQYLAGADERKLKMGLLNAQLAEHQAQAKLRDQQAAQIERRNKWLTSMIGELDDAVPKANEAVIARTGNLAPTNANAALQSQAVAQLTASNPLTRLGIPREAAQMDLMTNDGKHIGEWMFQRGVPKWRVDNAYRWNENDPNVSTGFIPRYDVSTSGDAIISTPTANGGMSVSQPEGARALQLDKSLIGAIPDLVKKGVESNMRPSANGTQSPVPGFAENPYLAPVLAGILGNNANGLAPVVQQPRPAAQSVPPIGSPARPVIGANEQKARDAESILQIKAELAKPGIPENDRAGLQRELARLEASQSQPGFPTPSKIATPSIAGASSQTVGGVTLPSYGMTNEQQAAAAGEKARQEALARGSAERDNTNAEKANQFKDFRDQIGVARTLLKAGPTGSSVGALADAAANVVGVTLPGAEIAKQLDLVGGWMVQNIPKAPGSQSNYELDQYKQSAGQVANQNLPVKQRLAALNTLETLIDAWESRRPGVAAAKPTTVDALPNNVAVGTRARDTVTGKVLRFDGKAWVPEK